MANSIYTNIYTMDQLFANHYQDLHKAEEYDASAKKAEEIFHNCKEPLWLEFAHRDKEMAEYHRKSAQHWVEIAKQM